MLTRFIRNGTFTVESPRGHRTFKVWTAGPNSKLAGSRIVGMLTGSDNRNDYQAIGFVYDADGPFEEGRPAPDRVKFVLWRKFRSEGGRGTYFGGEWPVDGNVWEKSLAIFADLVTSPPGRGYFGAGGYTLTASTRCKRCNRELTDPVSLRVGIGPDCRGHYARTKNLGIVPPERALELEGAETGTSNRG